MKILIIIVVIIGLSTVIGAIFVGVKSFDGTVTEQPYEKGLAWDETRNREKELGWRVNLGNRKFSTGDNNVILSVFDKDGRPLPGASVSITISRPSTPDFDMNYSVKRTQDGSYRAAVYFPLYGNWDMEIHVDQKENKVIFINRVFVEKRT